jgi:hypothetical protein
MNVMTSSLSMNILSATKLKLLFQLLFSVDFKSFKHSSQNKACQLKATDDSDCFLKAKFPSKFQLKQSLSLKPQLKTTPNSTLPHGHPLQTKDFLANLDETKRKTSAFPPQHKAINLRTNQLNHLQPLNNIDKSKAFSLFYELTKRNINDL